MTSRNQMRYQVFLLSLERALFQTASVALVTIGSLAGSQISPEPHLATAPVAASILGKALTTAPASLWMARAGRKAGFMTGAFLGVLGGLIAAFGVYVESLFVLCIGTLLPCACSVSAYPIPGRRNLTANGNHRADQ